MIFIIEFDSNNQHCFEKSDIEIDNNVTKNSSCTIVMFILSYANI